MSLLNPLACASCYNSGLFHFTPEKNRREPPDEWSLSLKIDDRLLKDIIGRL